MKSMLFTIEELKANAIKEMENCMAYITMGDIKMAIMCCGSASVWEELLDELGFDLGEESEHYRNMLNIYCDSAKGWKVQ